jgi:hypothetical protein
MSQPTTCPKCGESIAITHTIGSGHPSETGRSLSDPIEEAATCSKCGTKLCRAAGQPWMEATGPGADVS